MNNRDFLQAARFDTWQLRAIRHYKGPMLVLAGPGSGKTTVLTNRIRVLTEERGVPEENILVITFTRLAAQEMKSRYLRLTGRKESTIAFGTFHSVFYSILRKDPLYREFEVAERGECLRLLYDVIFETYGKNALQITMAGDILDTFGKIKNGMEVRDEAALALFPLFSERMRERKLLDYDDMLSLCRKKLLEDESLRKELRERFRFLLIDEFQDVNRTQYETVKLVTGPEQNIFAVGDDDQSIYGFRGSSPAFMREFFRDFPHAKKVELSRNYRSTGEIVAVSRELIRNNRDRFRKDLRTKKRGGLRPVVVSFPTEKEEALYIDRTVRELMAAAEKTGYGKLTAALLARTHEALSRVTELLPEDTRSFLSAATFHASKGLEFDAVFIVAANEGITPEKRAEREGNTEEERRAFYVAMTRAKKFLHILYTETYYNKKSKVSRFVTEIM